MSIKHTFILLLLNCSLIFPTAISQNNHLPQFDFKNGIGITTPDSTFSFNIRFRTQLRAAYNTVSTSDMSASEIEARVRRMRLRFDGFMFNPKLNYSVQLSFSRGDMDWVDADNSVVNSSPNVVRDAFVSYKPTQHLTFIFGQTKLPGNRQRVVSSGALQFADRSIVNAVFTTDRDFGAQFKYVNTISKLQYVIKGAISSGEGRNSVKSNAGLAYTGRIELLPFGKFANNGDYFEGDLEREQKIKVSLAVGFHHNESALRTAGTLGNDLYTPTTMNAVLCDFLVKYKGFAMSAEYINRSAINPITVNALNEVSSIYVGEGKMVQMSYLFKNNFEIASRYAIVTPYSAVQFKELERQEIGLGVTKYLMQHKVKLQGNLFYNTSENLSLSNKKENLTATFQIELGI